MPTGSWRQKILIYTLATQWICYHTGHTLEAPIPRRITQEILVKQFSTFIVVLEVANFDIIKKLILSLNIFALLMSITTVDKYPKSNEYIFYLPKKEKA